MKSIKPILGFSLLEVLIAASILTFGLLGVAGLYINSLKRTGNAYWHVLATSQWIEMMEQQRAADYNCLDWQAECKQLLPHGECKCDGGNISICWDGKSKKHCL